MFGKVPGKESSAKNNSWNSKFNVVNFEDVATVNNYSFHSTNDNYFSTNNKLGVVNGIHGSLSTCNTYNNLDSLDKYLRLQTGNTDTSLLKIKGFNLNPNFVNPSNGDFQLNTNSLLIDQGQLINNISDLPNENYFGTAPDIGALEKQTVTAIGSVTINNNITLIYPNPSNGIFTIRSTKNIKQVSIYALNGKLLFTNKYNSFSTSKQITLKNTSTGIFIVKTVFVDNTVSNNRVVF